MSFGQAGAFRLVVLFVATALAELDIRTEAAVALRHFQSGLRVLAQYTGGAGAVLRHQLAGVAAFRIVGAADESAEPADLQIQPAGAALRADARVDAVSARREHVRGEHLVERVDHLGEAHVLDLIDGADEVLPEVAQHLAPIDLGIGDLVELLFQIGGEIIFHVAHEERFEEGDHHAALVFGDEALLVEAHVAAVAQHLQHGGIGRGPADAELLHALDQRGFGEARRRLGEMLAGEDGAALGGLAFVHLGKTLAVLVLLVVVVTLLVEGEEAVELDDRAGRAQVDRACAGARLDVDRGALELGQLHLAGERAQPDQLIELGLIGIEIARDVARAAVEIGRADGFVRLLRVLGFVFVDARGGRHILLAVILGDHLAGLGDGLAGQLDAVGAHIGDEAHRLAVDVGALIEALGDAHGDGRGEAELAAGFLLERRGGERRVGVALGRLRFDRGDLEGRGSRGPGGDRRLRPWTRRRGAGSSCRRPRPGGPRTGRRARSSSWATMDQYSCGTNISISRSRSQTSRSATDWTRPAERAPGSFRHRTGEMVKPTR